MLQKITWMRCSIIGISFFLITLNSCSKDEKEYRLDADITYKNETGHSIKYYQFDTVNSQKIFVFELLPNSEKKIEIRASGGDKNQTVNDCCQGLFEGFQGRGAVLVDFDNNEKCLIFKDGQGPTTGNISAYSSREISEGYFEYIYQFTKEDYNKAEKCN